MYGTVSIGNKEVDMVANAATPYRYQQIFREDYLKKVSGKEETDPTDFFVKIGFVMAMQAAKKDMSKINMESFYKWLEGFEPADVFAAAGDIADVYNGEAAGNVDPK